MMLISNITQNQVDLGKQLLEACRNGNTEEVKSLMQSGAAFTTDWMGTSPLHFAAQYGHVEVLDVLLKAGVSRDTRTKVDLTPLHLAAQGGHLEIVSQLVQHGADIEAKDLLKMTPLHWAVQRGYFDIVECLLMNGADPNAVSKFDKTPLDIAYDVGYLDMVPILQVCIYCVTVVEVPSYSTFPCIPPFPRAAIHICITDKATERIQEHAITSK